ncbi:MAG: hypothetical protein V4543_15160 [Bacteroidota bacterium]
MVSVLILWIVYGLVFTAFGHAVTTQVEKLMPEKTTIPGITVLFLTGIAIAGSIAGIVSLFSPVNTITTGIPLLVLAGIYAIASKDFRQYAVEKLSTLKAAPVALKACIALVFAGILMKCASESLRYDEGLYYIQTVKWIENYAVVPGLANLHHRLCFNSNWHLLSAAFGLRPFYIGSTYRIIGLLCIIVWAFEFPKAAMGPRSASSIFAFICSINGLFMLSSGAYSLEPDYVVATFIVFIYYRFLKRAEAGSFFKSDTELFILFFLSFYTITLKLSACFIVLPAIITAGYAWLKGSSKPLMAAIPATAIILIVWMTRFSITTGWILFPFRAINLINPDWKLPESVIINEENYINAFARSVRVTVFEHSKTFAEINAMPFNEWIPMWFFDLKQKDKIEMIILGISLLIGFTICLGPIYKKLTIKKSERAISYNEWLILFGSVFAALLFWFIKAPAYRFAIGFIFVAKAMCLAMLTNSIKLRLPKFTEATIITAVAFIFLFLIRDKEALVNHPVFPAPLPKFETGTDKINNMEIYVPAMDYRYGTGKIARYRSENCWDAPLPCSIYYNPEIEMRGPSLGDGFRVRKQ